jgi:hypothetical protein
LNVREIVEIQFRELIEKYPTLILHWNKDTAIVEGELNFNASFNGIEITDTYNIRIEIPPNYPKDLPLTKETGGRIPAYFHKLTNNALCLEIPTKMQIEFMQNPTLLFYVEKFVVEYLYGFSYKRKFGHLPYGERPHGNAGITDFYKELLNVSDDESVIGFLKILSSGIYRGHHSCPCNSGKRLRNCHGKIIRELMQLDIPKSFQYDFNLLTKK